MGCSTENTRLPPGTSALVRLRQQPLEVRDVVQRKRAVDQVERGHRQRQALHVGPAVDDGRVRAGGPGARQHVLGHIDALDVGRALLARPAAEPAEAAAEVQHPAPAHIGQHAPAAPATPAPRPAPRWSAAGGCSPRRTHRCRRCSASSRATLRRCAQGRERCFRPGARPQRRMPFRLQPRHLAHAPAIGARPSARCGGASRGCPCPAGNGGTSRRSSGRRRRSKSWRLAIMERISTVPRPGARGRVRRMERD